MAPLSGKVCIVTGATRGLGKGIAIQLAEKGAKVYITGRTLDPQKNGIGGSLKETVREAEARGGHCIAIKCDHTSDAEVKQLFDQVAQENDEQLDILVNNVYSAVLTIGDHAGEKFWEQPVSMWDSVNNVGLRNHYVCAHYAAKLMVPRKQGLIVNISSVGGIQYFFNCAYGIGKTAVDRMAADCGTELKPENVAFVSLWPGPIGTESLLYILQKRIDEYKPEDAEKHGVTPQQKYDWFAKAETAEFVGKCVAALAQDPNIMEKSGKILMTAEMGREYKLRDNEGHTPVDIRQVNNLLMQSGYHYIAVWIPDFVRIPKWLMAMSGKKFY